MDIEKSKPLYRGQQLRKLILLNHKTDMTLRPNFIVSDGSLKLKLPPNNFSSGQIRVN